MKTDPRAIEIDTDGHARIPGRLLAIGDWLVSDEAGEVVAIDLDHTGHPAADRWPVLNVAPGGYAYGFIGNDTPLAVCTHEPRCGPRVDERAGEGAWR